ARQRYVLARVLAGRALRPPRALTALDPAGGGALDGEPGRVWTHVGGRVPEAIALPREPAGGQEFAARPVVGRLHQPRHQALAFAAHSALDVVHHGVLDAVAEHAAAQDEDGHLDAVAPPT